MLIQDRGTIHRRDWGKLTAAAGLMNLPGFVKVEEAAERSHPAKPGPEISLFTKPFNSLAFPELAARVRQAGFDAIEAPIRKGGYIEPDAVPDRLPALVAALKQQGLSLSILTTDINDPNHPQTERILKTAAALGIEQYRLKYFHYDENRPIEVQLKNWKAQLTDLAAMNQQLGVQGVYQNHSGRDYFGASLWDLARVLESIEVAQLGVAYDIRHATVEGGFSWPVTMRMIMPHVAALYVKDFAWEDRKAKHVPLGTGMVDRRFLKIASQAGFHGPISLHEEYLDHRPAALVDRHFEAMQRDLGVLKNWLADSQ